MTLRMNYREVNPEAKFRRNRHFAKGNKPVSHSTSEAGDSRHGAS